MLRFKIIGMTCDHCVRAVKAAVASADPHASADVDLGTGMLVVHDSKLPAARLAQAVEAEGYAAELV
jgi:copper chaperone